MKATLVPGIRHTHRFTVTKRTTAPQIFPESPDIAAMPEVLATGFMVGLMEWACIEAMKPHLDDGEGSVGIQIDVTHTAPTPVGMEVTVDAECVEVDGRRATFRVTARDEVDVIGEARHGRFIVAWDRFNEKLAQKTAGTKAG